MLGFAVFWDDLKLGLGDDKKKFLVVKIKKPHDMRVQGKYHFKRNFLTLEKSSTIIEELLTSDFFQNRQIFNLFSHMNIWIEI